MECFRSVLERKRREVWANTKSNFDRSVTKRFHYENTISERNLLCGTIIEKQERGIKAAWRARVLSQIRDLKLSIRVQSVLSAVSLYKSNPWLIETSFKICHELVTDSLEAAAALNSCLMGHLRRCRGVVLGSVGGTTGYGQRKGQ